MSAAAGVLIFPAGMPDALAYRDGDGPRKVADAFVERNAARIAARFQAGPTLFVQLRETVRG